MKSLSIIILAIAASYTQAKGQQAFKNAAILQIEHYFVVSFSVPSEVNIYQYRIEAGNDSTQMEVTGVIKPKGNSVMERNYLYETFDTAYKYYRVAAVGMGCQVRYSAIMIRPQIDNRPGQKPCAPKQCETNAVARGN
jgi:hypothetical protein